MLPSETVSSVAMKRIVPLLHPPGLAPRAFGRFRAGIICALVVAIGALLWAGFHQPSERLLERRFNEQRAAFDRLSEMKLEDDTIGTVYARAESNSGSSADGVGLPQARLNEYEPLFLTTGVKRAISRGSGDIYLDAWANVFVHGTHLGYVHCGPSGLTRAHPIGRWPCIEQKESGSGEDDSEKNGFYYAYQYKRIAPDWYILKASY
jgi:hypothetical protein